MPISGSYQWTESPNEIEISIPLKGTSPKSIDIFTAETVLKVSYPPFRIDLNLFQKIHEENSKALLKNGTLYIRLAKQDRGQLWNTLIFKGSKSEVAARRHRALEKRYEWEYDYQEKAKQTKWEEERSTLRKQMGLEQEERQRLDDMKAAEKQAVEKEVYDTFARLEKERSAALATKNESRQFDKASSVFGESKDCSCEDEADDEDKAKTNRIEQENNNEDKIVPDTEPSSETAMTAVPEPQSKQPNDDSLSSIPAPRSNSVTIVNFQHTPRLFKTPIRESSQKREQDFIAKHRPYLKLNKLLNKDGLDVGDSDPVWLKKKGDEFYAGGDYRSAINAYSSAFEADGSMISVLSNRAACYLQLGEARRCIADCETALKLLNAATENRMHGSCTTDEPTFRGKLLVRMAMARYQIGQFERAKQDLQQAIDDTPEDPTDSTLRRELEMVDKVQRADQTKKRADEALANGDLTKALACYDETLQIAPKFVNALSNRAACRFAAGDLHGCIRDCTQALHLLSDESCFPSRRRHENDTTSSSEMAMFTGFLIPPPGSEKGQQGVLSTRCRRAAAKARLQDFEGAVRDLEMAHEIVAERNEDASKDILEDITVLKEQIKQNETQA